MLRKTLWALLVLALVNVLLPAEGSARGGFRGGGFHGSVGGFHGLAGAGFRDRGFAAVGGRGWRRTAFGVVGVGIGLGATGGVYGYPLDDSYDYPFGYGEYAEYGPWAYRADDGARYRGCYPTRLRVWTPAGWRLLAVRVCG